MTFPGSQRVRLGLVSGLTAVAATLALSAFGSAAKPANNPPGANGTVKIDGVPFDTAPDNQPHVGCVFQVDFYGFDQGPYDASVNFTMQPPSGRRSVLDDTVFVGEDPAGGGTDLDAEATYDLNMLVYASERHPQQGFHVTLTVLAPGAGGKVAKKSKTFWLTDCVDP
ncbi:MAG: hypothetical protein QOI10_2757 [Solirubrobacterales bacterium]|jgi:hypothetical protein|nr:hypothetical protein [Solirubrobacterales bacterium]